MNNRLVDLLAKLAQKQSGDIYVTLSKAQSWNISTDKAGSDYCSARLDRNNLKHSIACEVAALSVYLPKVELY